MKITIIITFILITSIALISCLKSRPPVDINKMFTCHNELEWDSTLIVEELFGTWEWEFVRCFWNPEEANNEEFKRLYIEFNENYTLRVIENDETTLSAAFSIEKGYLSSYRVKTTDYIFQLAGDLIFCENRLLTSASATDGCDHFFKRM